MKATGSFYKQRGETNRYFASLLKAYSSTSHDSFPPTPETLLFGRVSCYFKVELSYAVQQPSKHLLGIAVWFFVHLILREKSGCAVVEVRANAVLGNRQKCYHYILRVTLVVTLFEKILKTIAITAMTPERPLHVSLCEIYFARFAVRRISSSPPRNAILLNP